MNFHKDASCKECKFFFAMFQPSELAPNVPKLVGGQCRKNCPTVGFAVVIHEKPGTVETGGNPTVTQKIERCSANPHVMPDYWCGQFERRTV